ncbi:MAG: SMC family ATPase, partial [Candidatus Micrarchaeota archaeon]|nr:SMC family ATPase [Candidatus Micrarchaeota archaeon]
HAHSEISLARGTNIFLGPMGSGKSSVVDALCFALYGTYPKLGRRDVKLEEVTNFRHTGQSVWVEVEWTENGTGTSGSGTVAGGSGGAVAGGGRVFKVRRELDTAQAWIYADGKMLQKGPKAVSEEVARILGISYDLFARAVYAEQNRLDYWLSLPAGTRKAELDRLLGLDSFESARAGATAKLNSMKEQAAGLEAAAPASRLDEARAQLKRRQEERGKLEAQLLEARARKKAVDEQAAGAQAQYLEGEKTQRHLQMLSERKQKLLGSISALEKTLGQLPNGVELDRAREMREQAKAAKAEAQKIARWAAQTEQLAVMESGHLDQKVKSEAERAARVAKLDETRTQLLEERTVEQLREQLAGAQTRLTEQLAEAARAEERLADAHKVLQALAVHSHLEGPEKKAAEAGALEGAVSCPVCKQPLDGERLRQLRGEEEARIGRLTGELNERRAAIATLKISHEKLMRREAEVSRLEAQLGALSPAPGWQDVGLARQAAAGAVATTRTAAAEAAQKLAAAEAAEHEADVRVRALEQSKQWQDQLMDARRALAEAEADLGSISFSAPLWNDLLARREKLMREQAALEAEEQSLGKLIEAAAQLAESARLVVADLEEKRAAADARRKEMDELGAFRTVLGSTQGQLRALLIAEINSALMRLWPLVYPYGDWTGVRLSAGEKDYAVEIQQGQWKSLEAHASGGERACLGLCLRAALSILLTPQLGWLILDEPTHNLDAPAVQQLGRAMADKLPQIIGQVIVITHEGQLLESTPGRVIRFARDKERGEVTQAGAE